MKMLSFKGGVMPALGFGTWQLTGEQCVKAVENAIAIGYRHIDTAQIYENEAEVGKALAETGMARSDVFVTTKLWTSNLTAVRVAPSLEESLQKLRMDYVDLLLIHWPNPEVKLHETLDAMQKLLAQGKTRAIGVSNFPVRAMQEAVEQFKAPIACNQVEYHALLSQAPVLDYARKHKMILTAYSPLARGKLSQVPAIVEIGKKYGKSAEQIGLRWLLEQDGVAAIPKAATEKHARSNFDIFDFELSKDDTAKIDTLTKTQRLINPDFAPKWDAA